VKTNSTSCLGITLSMSKEQFVDDPDSGLKFTSAFAPQDDAYIR